MLVTQVGRHFMSPLTERRGRTEFMRAFTNTSGSLAVAGLAVCALLIGRLPLEPWPLAAQAQTAKPVEKQVKKKAPARTAEPKASTPAEANARPARAPFGLEDEAAAVVLGLPE